MTSPSAGRHRRTPIRRTLPLAVAGGAAVVLVAVAVGATVLVTGRWGATDTSAPTHEPSTTTTAAPTPAQVEEPVALDGTRTVRVRDEVVTVTETTTVAGGDAVVLAPARRSSDSALALSGVQLVAEDGTATAFTDPVTVTTGRTITVLGTYRMLSCPDLLPVTWPSPAVPRGGGWSRTWTRTSEPLRTADTLCPRAAPTARRLPGLSARLGGSAGPGDLPAVRVVVRRASDPAGTAPFVVRRIGALGGLAAEAPRISTHACGAAPCVLALRPGRSQALPVQVVESCPDTRPRSDRLTFVVGTGTGPRGPRLWAVDVPGLGRWLDRHACR
jgi:hypothetical protein